MAKIHGKNAVIQIEDSGGTLRNITAQANNVTAPTNVDTAEVQGFGDVSKSYVIGQQDTPVALAGPWSDGTAVTEIHPILSGLLRGTGVGGSAGYDLRLCPAGTASTTPRMRGRVLLANFEVQAGVGGAVQWTAQAVPAIAAGLVWELTP